MEKVISVVSYVDDIIQVKLTNVMKHPTFVAKIFTIVSEQGVNIDMISQVALDEEMQLAFTCDEEAEEKLLKAISLIKAEFPQIEVLLNKMVSKICVEGEAMEHEVGVATKMFTAFANTGIPFYQVTTSSTSISYIIDKDNRSSIVKEIEKQFSI